MELKQRLDYLLFLVIISSNRTFMELKQELNELETKATNVLIVPLWN